MSRRACDVIWCDSSRCQVRLTGSGMHRSKPLTVAGPGGARLVMTMTQADRGRPHLEVALVVELTAPNIAGQRAQGNRLAHELLLAVHRTLTPGRTR